MLIENFSLGEAVYMTVITVSTVGFSEVHPLSTAGKIFTSILIVTSFGTFAYAITSITNYLIGGEYKKKLLEYKAMKQIEKLDRHIIVCGFGRVGNQVVNDLNADGKDFVVIDESEESFEEHGDDLNLIKVIGDATREDVLQRAGIEKASALITTLPDDAKNLYVVLSVKELNSDVKIITRASRKASVKKLRVAGAHNVIMPDIIGGAHMASLVMYPDVMEFIDTLSIRMAPNKPSLLEVKTGSKEWAANNLGAVQNLIPNNPILGVKLEQGEIELNPPKDTLLQPETKLFILAEINEMTSIRSQILL